MFVIRNEWEPKLLWNGQGWTGVSMVKLYPCEHAAQMEAGKVAGWVDRCEGVASGDRNALRDHGCLMLGNWPEESLFWPKLFSPLDEESGVNMKGTMRPTIPATVCSVPGKSPELSLGCLRKKNESPPRQEPSGFKPRARSISDELVALNQELTLINDQLQDDNEELSRLNNDLSSLFDSLDLAVLILGKDLSLRRFNQEAGRFFDLPASALGQPLTDLKPHLVLPDFAEIVERVIRTSRSKEMGVQDREGRWHLLRVGPYRTSDNKAAGAAVLLVSRAGVRAGKWAESPP